MMSESKKSLHDFYEMKMRDVMQTSKKVPFIQEDAPLDQVLPLLKDHGYVWVGSADAPKHIIGVITESDMIALLSPPLTTLQPFDHPDARSLQFGVPLTAEEIMSKKPVTASPDETVRVVIVKMKQFRVKQLPVVDPEGTLFGDITLHEFIERYYKEVL
jgi:CBS-domain-containing membrane protein